MDNHAFIDDSFFPIIMRRQRVLGMESRRLAYYCTAETAAKILKNKELWLRNARDMNDFSELEWGIGHWKESMKSDVGRRLIGLLGEVSHILREVVMENVEKSTASFLNDTYIMCLSEHRKSAERDGRLSMWRAYGDVALVFRVPELSTINGVLDLTAPSLAPVMYLSRAKFEDRLATICDRVHSNLPRLQAALNDPKQRDYLIYAVLTMIRHFMVCTKHPGFQDEREWRLVYSPTADGGKAVDVEAETVGGRPELVCKLRINDRTRVPYSLGDLLEGIIIGPTRNPRTLKTYFEREIAGDLASCELAVSDIPLRR